MSKKKKKKLIRDIWSLDAAFINWLDERLKAYLKYAGKYIDLEYHEFKYKGKTYTQKQLILRMLELTKKIKDNHLDLWQTEEYDATINELLDIWKLVFTAMWW